MKKILQGIFLLVFLSQSAFGAVVESAVWENGNTLFGFFQKYNIPTSVYYDLNPEDRELTSEIYAGVRYFTALDSENNLVQALIPIGDGMQIHISRHNGSYKIDFTPIAYFETKQQIVLSIQKSAYQDLMELTDDKGLVNEFLSAYKNSVNFSRNVLKGDRLALVYERKYRLGNPLGNARIKAAMIETNKKPNYLFSFNNGRYYDIQGKEIEGFLLYTPIKTARISSRFSLGRKHPILGFVRPHYGVDYAAPKGSTVLSAGNGVINFVGKKGGYGNVIEIRHENGLKTIYAHLDSFAPGMKTGKSVKKGQYIAKVGSTGLSTGPHLHFGVYKNNRPINPLGNIKTQVKELLNKEKEEFLALANAYKGELDTIIAQADTEQKQALIVRLSPNDDFKKEIQKD
ncbi:endopeptidase [Helicobacter sp. MIT 00-7814]|uniref:peptidoglycan DD-metalloendopeptidase family protein n=1 Tax=unclassified Helicobacter TaxID=2593540 RepID=UPI000E1EF09F|nr:MULTISPECIES: peptidoglycan DD-metalloendopeptidase family protein [unclassified Helicobacter]RDU54800.1 endopeptidase [Helicobacter sp. MIT 99-10781]RDU54858.1 endopeptidase [Helicobacter sp. MIT 00-7814]